MAYPKPHSIIFMGVQWFTIVGGIVSVIYTKVTGDMRYTIYTTTSIMAYFSPFFFMHFTRVFDYWQAIPQDGKRYGSALTTLKAKEKTQKSRNRKSFN